MKRPATREETFLMIFSRYSDPLFYYVLKLTGNEEHSKDIIQECFIRVWENIEKIDMQSDLLPLLVTYIKNLLRDEYRKKRNYHYLLAEIGEEMKDINSRPAVEDTIALKERQRRLDLSLDQLSEKKKNIFRMVKLEGLSYREVADTLNISIADIKKQMRLSLQFLRKAMKVMIGLLF